MTGNFFDFDSYFTFDFNFGFGNKNDDPDDKYRSIDGTGYTRRNRGAAGDDLRRIFNRAFYEDGVGEPRGGGIDEPSTLPNPRDISNIVHDQDESVTNFLGASDWLWQWGQFLDHDLDLNEGGSEPFLIEVNPLDVSTGLPDPLFPIIPFTRVPGEEDAHGVRQQANEITSFIDASSVYGSDDERAEALRLGEEGLLLTTIGDNGEVLLPFNTFGLENANALGLPEEELYLAGDVRANEQLGLTAVHTLFVREHNNIAISLLDDLDNGDVDLTEEFNESGLSLDDFLYESARKVVGAEVQVITYEEFLPLLIGDEFIKVKGIKRKFGGGFGLEDYDGFNPRIDPSVSNEFANAAYRLGHTLLSPDLLRVESPGEDPTASIALQDAFFDPDEITTNGVDTLLTGLADQEAQELDNLIVDGVRDFLFPAGTGGLDLASVNIQRGREVGLPSYVTAYNRLGLRREFGRIRDFDDLTESGIFSEEVVAVFEEAYDSVRDIDLWTGIIGEDALGHVLDLDDPTTAGLLGPVGNLIVSDQFRRARDGDPFYYENDLEHLELLSPGIGDTTLSEIINRNTETGVDATAFIVEDSGIFA